MILNKSQIDIVNAPIGPVMVISGAGTGKTTVIVERYNYINKELALTINKKILVITFNKKARFEIMKRINGNQFQFNLRDDWIETYHSFSKKILHDDISNIEGYHSDFLILSDYDSKKIIRNIKDTMKKNDNNFASPENSRYFLNLISNIKHRYKLIHNDLINLLEKHDSQYFDMQNNHKKIIIKYLEEQKNNNYLDFDDLIIFALNLLNNYPKIRKKYQDIFCYIMVDEFQDIEPSQYEILKLLVNEDKNIFIVGDPDQCIYEWRRARPDIMLKTFPEDFKDAKKYHLFENYRSTENILNACNNLISNNYSRDFQKKPLVSGTGKKGLPIQVYKFFTESQESLHIAQEIKTSINNGLSPNNIAILVRYRKQFMLLEKELKKNNIDYVIYGGVSFFEKIETKLCIALLFMTIKENKLFHEFFIEKTITGIGPAWIKKFNNISLKKGYKNHLEYFCSSDYKNGFINPKSEIEKKLIILWNSVNIFRNLILENEHIPFNDFKKHFLNLFENIKLNQYFETIKESSIDLKERLENINIFLGMFNKDNNVYSKDIKDILSEIDNFHNENDNDSKVTLSTIHAIKGLEYDTVYVPGLTESNFPNSYLLNFDSDKNLEEERRIAYVSFTRCINKLVLSYYDYVINRGIYSKKSRFIIELD